MRRVFWIYLPPLLLMIAAMILPRMGRNFVGQMNACDFTLFIAFWWMAIAVGFRFVLWLVRASTGGSDDARGFDVIQKD